MHYLIGHYDEVTGALVNPKNKLQVLSSVFTSRMYISIIHILWVGFQDAPKLNHGIKCSIRGFDTDKKMKRIYILIVRPQFVSLGLA